MKEQIDTSSPEFQNALTLIRHTHHSLFLTGKAGTGKSTFLRYVCSQVKKKHVVLAPTGIAAINAGGTTLHSFFKLPFHPLLPDDPKLAPAHLRDFLKYNKTHIKLLREVELVIIDEISMVRADIIDFIDRVLRVFCQKMREPFGGKQMLFIGDVFQLEPVVKPDERAILNRFYPNPYFFSARVFREIRLVSIELTKVFRQRDRGFIATLDRIRNNTATDLELKLLNTRYTEEPQKSSCGNLNIVLATRRDNVDYINQSELDRLQGESVTLKGVIEGEFPSTSLPTLMELEIKEGAQIIFVKNDQERRWVNGTLGTVSHIDMESGRLYVDTEKHSMLEVEPERWSNVRYTYNEKEKRIEEEELGTFTQYPIRLAWAITIHKSQGLTFDRATIDFGGGTFTGGQAYVALSRCTSLEGLTLKKRIQRSDIFVSPDIVAFASQFNNEGLLQHALSATKADTEYRACAEAFDKGDMAACIDHFIAAIHSRYDIEKPQIKRLIRRKLNIFRTLREEADKCKEKLQQQERKMQAYAKEYYLMGNECATEAHLPKAAIANYRKAIDMYPGFLDAHVRLAVTLLGEGMHHEALTHLNIAVSLSPASFKAYYQRGKAYMAMQRYEEAVNDLDHAVRIKEDHPQSHKLIGDCYAHLGQEDKAAIYWSLAEELRKKK